MVSFKGWTCWPGLIQEITNERLDTQNVKVNCFNNVSDSCGLGKSAFDLYYFFFFFLDAVSVEPTYSYYEKVSEELERIVHEVQEKEEVEPLSDGEKHNSEAFFFVMLWSRDHAGILKILARLIGYPPQTVGNVAQLTVVFFMELGECIISLFQQSILVPHD